MNAHYALAVEGRLDEPLSRWKWLVKWILALPHVVVLAFLWVGVVVATLIALVARLATGRHPRRLFDFTVGVMRWTWRVEYYAFGALATDRYPPFTLADVPDYPARLQISYPEGQTRRGLPLIGWWLLGIPHYAVAGLLAGGAGIHTVSVIGVLVLVAGILLLSGRGYHRGIFDLVMGFNRWVLRATAYGALLTDEYPPFRLDMGGMETAPSGAGPVPGTPLHA